MYSIHALAAVARRHSIIAYRATPERSTQGRARARGRGRIDGAIDRDEWLRGWASGMIIDL